MPACSQPDPRKPQDLEREKPFLSVKEREALAKARAETLKGLPEQPVTRRGPEDTPMEDLP